MIKAVEGLSIKPDILLIDAVKLETDIKQCSITKGDFKSYSIGCASIVAKVTRDRMMDELPEEYQKYKERLEHYQKFFELPPASKTPQRI